MMKNSSIFPELNLDEEKLIIITGAAGFIGSCVARYLNDAGYTNLVLVDNLGQGTKWKNIAGKQFKEFLMIDELLPWLEGREEDIQAFIHLGANSSTTESDVDALFMNNYRYSVALAEYALDHEIRFIYASSAATYGDGSLGFCDDLLEELRPMNPYGFSKQLFDLWAHENGVLSQLTALKYFNIYGPNENEKGNMASMVYKMVPLLQKKGVLELFKPLREGVAMRRDFLYVKDAAAMTCRFLSEDGGGIYNIGSGIATSWEEMGAAVCSALNIPLKIKYISMPEEIAAAYQSYTRADMSKYRSHFTIGGAAPITDYSLQGAVDDYVKNCLVRGARW